MATSKKVKTQPAKILVVDDEPGILEFLGDLLDTFGYMATTVEGGEQAVKLLEEETYDLILVDLKMPKVDGLGVLRRAKALDPDAAVVFLTGYMTLENALEMMRAGGAFDCLSKPLEDIHHLQLVVEKALSFRKARAEIKQRNEELAARHTELMTLIEVSKVITSSLNLKDVLDSILQLCTKLMSVKHASIMLVNEQQELESVAGIGFVKKVKHSIKLKVGESLSGWVVAHGEILVVQDMRTEPRYKFPQIARKYNLRSYLGIPLKIKEKILGVLNIYTEGTPRKFSENEIRLYSNFADQAAIAIDHAQLYEKLHQINQSGRNI